MKFMKKTILIFLGIFFLLGSFGCNWAAKQKQVPTGASPETSPGSTRLYPSLSAAPTPAPTPTPIPMPDPYEGMTDKEIWEAIEKELDAEMQALLTLTPGPEPYPLLEAGREVKTGDVVVFGRYAHHWTEEYYWKREGSEQIPVKWLVLEQEGEKALLLSVLNVDVAYYYESTWAESNIREWLNGEFIYRAFDEDERGCIRKTNITTEDNPVYGTDGGADTEDYVFLLSIKEAETYFSSDEERRTQTKPDVYIDNDWVDLIAYQHMPRITDYYGWWLRTPGFEKEWVAYVDNHGRINYRGEGNYTEVSSIRPAMWIDLNRVRELAAKQADDSA